LPPPARTGSHPQKWVPQKWVPKVKPNRVPKTKPEIALQLLGIPLTTQVVVTNPSTFAKAIRRVKEPLARSACNMTTQIHCRTKRNQLW